MHSIKSPYFREIRVRNYKNLKEANLAVGDFSILVGRNNSGKSNFFEVVSLLRNLFLKGQEGKQHIKRKLGWPFGRKETPTQIEVLYSLQHEVDHIEATYFAELRIGKEEKFEVSEEYILYKVVNKTGPQKKLFERLNSELRIRVESETGSTFREHSVALDASAIEILPSILVDPSKDQYVYKLLIDPLIQLAKAPIFKTHELSSNYIPEIHNRMKKLKELEEAGDPKFALFKESFCEILDIKSFRIEKAEIPQMKEKFIYFCIIMESAKQHPTFIDDMSDGTRVLFLMLYHLFISSSPIVFIDEPEIGLHPHAISKFLGLIVKRSVTKQVVLATHSAFLLNLVNPKNVTLSEPDEMGMSTFRPVSEIPDLQRRLKSKYINFGDLFADNFRTQVDTSL